ncbi:MAG: hypothetical protein Q8K86_01535, partial [Candidatus Nanopelagicaceae bacterium]|nr:hypothetical protein [Candidatus Nanopelagicaceae bacterium]
MTDYRIPPPSTLVDQQFIQVVGPDGLASSFLYDSQSLTLYIKESQIIIPPFHGQTHVTSDLVPTATCDRQGHMSADDKCKLDSMAQTRIGVLGFSGAGFSDDGGFLTGDIILAAGTEFISLERIGNVIRFVCFTGDCGVLLPDGTTKRIDTMVAGEEVVTHDGSVQKVTQLFKNEVHEDILHVEVSGHRKNAFKATCDHPILAIRQPNVGRCSEHRVRNCRRCLDRYAAPEWIRAGELHEGDFIVRRFSSDVVVDKQSVAISDYADDILVKEGKAFSQMKRKMVSNAVGSYEINDEFTTCAVAVVDEIKVDDEFLRLCGYYLAEGSLGRTHGKKATTVQFTISAEEAFDDLGADIVHCIKHVFGITPKIYRNNKRGTAHAVTLHSSIAARFIDHLLPGRCHTKRIPRWMMELSPEKQKQILVGFMRGDGYRRDGQRCRQMMTGICNEQLANQLCALFERIGASPVISYKSQFSKQTGRCYDRYTVQVQASDAPWLWEAMDGKPLNFHRLDFGLKHSGYTLRQVKNIQRVRHDGFVYNIEVEHNHSYVVNGLAVHNCDSPLPLACDCESCFQIYWQQDESDVLAIRPPACNGKLPGVNAYGELKIYLLPET